MKIVIDIPDKDYERIMTSNEVEYYELKIAQGIPLPKGHGRLIDADTIKLPPEEMISRLMIKCAETIIEADR